MQPQLNQVLEPGSVLLVAGGVKGCIRASQLGELSLGAFNVIPSRLTGLITLIEQGLLERALSREESLIKFLPAQDPIALKLGELHGGPNREGLQFRLRLFQLFVEMISNELQPAKPHQDSQEAFSSDSKMRLQLFLRQTPSSELLEMNFSELAQRTHCSPRHLGRIFHELVGMSFGEKRAELRLERARELLATTNSKIVDVALESGYKSLSLFNMMFSRRFGISPGKWRQKHESNDKNSRNSRKVKYSAPETNKGVASLHINVSASPAQDRRQKRQKSSKKMNGKNLAQRVGRVSILQK